MRGGLLDREPHAKPSDCRAIGKEQDQAEDAENDPKRSVIWQGESSRADPGKEKNFSRKQR